MSYEVAPLPFKPHRLAGLSERLLVSHYENNYGGAVRRLNAIEHRMRHCEIRDPALDRLALIVRGADTARHDLAPEAAGRHAISLGLSANFPDDHAMLERGMVIYDALYSWCRDLKGEVHNWKPAAGSAAAPDGVP